MVFAVHLKINAKGGPTRTKVGLPLQLYVATRHRQRPFAARFVVKGDGAILGVHLFHRHIQHTASFRVDGQEAGIGLLTLFAQRGQHDRHDRVITFSAKAQGVIKAARFVELGRGIEFVFEAERVQEPPQHGVVMVAKAVEFAVRVGHRGQRLLHMLAQHLLLGHVFGHFAHAVDIIGKADQTGGDI